MTYDTKGRRMCHPSTWPQEVEQLRARVRELEEALRKAMRVPENELHVCALNRMMDDTCGICGKPVQSRTALQKQEGE